MTEKVTNTKSHDLPIEFHRKMPGRSPESLRALAGVIVVSGPVPSVKFLEDEEQR